MVFGYGSLVNRATHALTPARPATLRGWRRQWQATGLRRLAFLSVERDTDAAIDGLLAGVPGDDWAALDAREYAYDRHPLSAEAFAPGTAVGEVAAQIYAVTPEHRESLADHPILLSYLDVVVQGFAREFGPEGVTRFFASTAGWEAPIWDDRAAPLYPRAQTLDAAETDLVDRHLRAIGARVCPAEALPAANR